MFSQKTDFAGSIKLKFWVCAEGSDDIDLHTALKKLDVTGVSMLFPDFQHCKGGIVASGWLRASHRVKVGAIFTEIRPWQNHE